MINPYNAIINPEDEYKFDDYLQRVNLYRIFEKIFEVYGNNIGQCRSIVRYIAYAYSLDSDKITAGGDRRSELKRIFDSVGLNEGSRDGIKELENQIIYLEESAISESARKWMEYQENDLFQYLLTLKDVYIQQQRGALSPLTEYDQKQKCVKHMNDLRQMIKDAASELIQNNDKLKEAHKEVQKAEAKNKSSMGIGSFV